MDELTSTEFRKTYATIKKAVVVTANGHPIGKWVPWNDAVEFQRERFEQDEAMGRHLARGYGIGRDFLGPRATQAQRDYLLRKINRGQK